MIKKIYQELARIRRELRAIRISLESTQNQSTDGLMQEIAEKLKEATRS